ncbi:tetratricopeptide repeat protein [Algoriphagus sp. D3-2-R+10]|uniref:tetratricopeptide repeat protein n=1 Tax=Algoriphagus aurantiacus TaxID=3103948 RepID=UPI002B3C355D|nr:tetratricopeptide repeat protein [Algoriphagus sp. D3-2-R+10]MEB2777079.1 tetratricopeptide repeat protein [Algoriphagus sp. D3-2-R+10]
MKRLILFTWGTVIFIAWFPHFSQAQTPFLIDSQLDSATRLAKSKPDKAFMLATEVLEESKLAALDSLVGKAQLIRGQILLQFGLFQPAVEAFYEAEHIFQNNNLPSLLAHVNNALGEVYYKIKSPEDALQRHETAFIIYQKLQDAGGEAETKSFIGGMYEKMGSYPKALAYQQEALKIFEELNLKSQLAFVRENIGSIYEDLEQYDSAYFNFQKAFVLNMALGDSLRIISNLNNLGDVLRKTSEPEEGLLYSEKAAEMSERLGFLYQQKSAIVDISKAYAEMRDYDNAYKYLEQSRQLSDLVYSEESARQLAVQEAQNSLYAKNQQIIQLEQMHDFDAIVKWLLLFLVGLMCVLGWVIFNRQKLKIKSNKELLERHQEILQVKEQLIATEQQNMQLLEMKMETEEKAHSKALTAQTLHVIDKNQMLEDIQTRLKSILEQEPKEQKKKIRNLIKQIDFNFSHDTDWEDFKHSFEKVHQDFFRNIHQRTGGLTPAEMKLASLMRLNLNSKEIASSLGISMDSLRISRYRLRKKLNLEKGDSLQQFLLCI